jgi:hypothetical protein
VIGEPPSSALCLNDTTQLVAKTSVTSTSSGGDGTSVEFENTKFEV